MSSVTSGIGAKHTCQLCGYQTSQKTHLKLMVKECPECEYQASKKSHLVNHHKSVHMGQTFQCPECEHQATQKGNLVTHRKTVHMSQQF